MGGQVSTASLQDNTFVQAICDPGVRNDDVPWEGLTTLPLCYPAALANDDLKAQLARSVADVVAHTPTTHRLGALLKRVCDGITQWASNRPDHVAYDTLCNQLLWLQYLLNAAVRDAAGDGTRLRGLCAMMQPRPEDGVRYVIDALVEFLTHHPVVSTNQGCLGAHSIAVACLTVCCSSPIYTTPSDDGTVTPTKGVADAADIDYVCNHPNAAAVLSTLLAYVNAAGFEHADALCDTLSGTPRQRSGGSGWLSIVSWISYYRSSSAASRGRVNSTKALSTDLGRRAALLLCVLLYHGKNRSKQAPHAIIAAFRSPAEEGVVRGVSVYEMFNIFCRPAALESPEMVLLLYTLLIESPSFLDHVVKSAEISRLVVPVCRLLSNIEGLWDTPASLYVLMSILLILSQYKSFTANVHAEVVPQVEWCCDVGLLRDVTSGSLLLLMLARIVHHNLAKGLDVYVSRQALSILSNMGGEVRNLHVVASQKLVILSIYLGRKLQKTPDPDAAAVFAEFLVNVTSCIALALSASIADNVSLVYELLHQQQKLRDLSQHLPAAGGDDPAGAAAGNSDTASTLHALHHAILNIVDYFATALSDDSYGTLNTVEATTQAIEIAALSWDGAGWATPLPDRYAFAEEPCPETFFVPHSWDLVVQHYPSFGWDAQSLPLFSSKDNGYTPVSSPAGAAAEPQYEWSAGPQQV